MNEPSTSLIKRHLISLSTASYNSAVNVGQILQAYASNFHESWKGWSEALVTCQTTEWPGHSVSYNTLEEIDDMVTGKRANIRLSDNYEDVSNIPVNM